MAAAMKGMQMPLRQTVTRQRTPLLSQRCLSTSRLPAIRSNILRQTIHLEQSPSKLARSLPAFSAFHTSVSRSILPPPPQHIEGTVNDPVVVPDVHPTHGSYHWVLERAVSAALIPLTIAPFAAGTLYPTTDAIFCALILIHSHIGFQSIVIDYIPVKEYPRARWVFWNGLNFATLLVAFGLYEFETNDVGVTEAVKRIWMA